MKNGHNIKLLGILLFHYTNFDYICVWTVHFINNIKKSQKSCCDNFIDKRKK